MCISTRRRRQVQKVLLQILGCQRSTEKRNQIQKHLKENGIATGIHYPTPLPFLEAYNYLHHKPGDFPVAYDYMTKILSLPIYPEISDDQINFVVSKVEEFFS